MSEMGKVLNSVKHIEGWLTDNEMKFLCVAAEKFSKTGSIVEVGSWKGRSTVCLALGAKKSRSKIYAIDPHIASREDKTANTKHEFKRNIGRFGLSGRVVPMIMKSEDAAKKWPPKRHLGLLWIDGSHEYKDVKQDFMLWEKHLQDGGLIAFHDSFFSGPSQIIKNYVIKSGKFSCIGRIDYITFAIKKHEKSVVKRKLNSVYFTLLRSVMRTEHMQPEFIRKLIKSSLLNDFKKLKPVK